MSLSEPLGSLPVVRHFYPINPQTSLQQQSAVYNTPDSPLVAPIVPASSQPFLDAHPQSSKKRKIKEVDAEIQYLGSSPSGSFSRTTANTKQRRICELSQEPSESIPIYLPPRRQRCIPYVELPGHSSIDFTLYRPVSLIPSALELLLGRKKHGDRARSLSRTWFAESPSPTCSDASTASEYLDSGRSIQFEKRQRNVRGKTAACKTKYKDILVFEDEATTCHQCRRKTTKEKMRCRRIRPNASVCPYQFCRCCIEVRYGEIFNSLHPTWHCPLCRGICNCSICLRKAGFGYILDGSMSEQFTGTQGRLSVAKQGTRHSLRRRVNTNNTGREDQPRVSVRAWLARKGIALGTEEWMMERRRQGVRYVVGNSPPPADVPSLYKEAQFNPTIAACTEYLEEDDDDDLSNSNSLSEGDADNMIASGPSTLNNSDATTISRTQGISSKYRPLPREVQPSSGALNGATAAETLGEPGSQKLPLPRHNMDPPACPASSEDLPGLSSALTHSFRLIIGKPLSSSMGKKKQPTTSEIKKRMVTKPKRKANLDVSDSDYYDKTTRRKNVLPAIRMRGCGAPDAGIVQDDEKEKEFIRGLSPISYAPHSPLHADALSSPPSPPEPVLVPTEYYAPSKLDAAMAKGSQAQFGHTYWTLNAVTPREHEHEYDNRNGHGSPSSLLMSTPLYSNNERHSYQQFSPDDVSPAGPSVAQSTSAPTSRNGAHQSPLASMSSSKLHAPNDYLNLHTHQARDDDAYAANGLAAFTTLDETWAAVDMIPYPNLEIDMLPLQVEGIAHAMDAALHGDYP